MYQARKYRIMGKKSYFKRSWFNCKEYELMFCPKRHYSINVGCWILQGLMLNLFYLGCDEKIGMLSIWNEELVSEKTISKVCGWRQWSWPYARRYEYKPRSSHHQINFV